jgi:hypothetical protein
LTSSSPSLSWFPTADHPQPSRQVPGGIARVVGCNRQFPLTDCPVAILRLSVTLLMPVRSAASARDS